ncbi:MAG TPA: hypothetical protein DEB40_00110 [Elusimicrobia bacterium]|nr:hypothetical protein [Elusimicrobiota bacterium]HBT60136.1 hypothetical protein [Elusimicrobiota bacterium]
MEEFEKSQVVVLSSIDWDAAWQRHQIFAWQLAQAGHEVFFVENSGFRNPGLKDLPRLWRKLRRLADAPDPSSQESLPHALRVMPPQLLPPTYPPFRRFNAGILIPQLIASLRSRGLRRHPLVITYFPTATTLELVRQLQPAAVIYDCASNFRAHPRAPKDFARQEAELLGRADLVICDSDFLYEQKRAEHGNVVQIHQGVPESFFAARPAEQRFLRFCYYGTWGQDLDPRFPVALAEAGFSVTVSGFSKGSASPLPPAIRRLPPVPREQLVQRLENFDVFILPYRINPFLLGVIPAKIYECLAMGRPILATPLPAFAPLRRLVYVADSPEDWVRIARNLPATETAGLREERRSLALEHTYPAEFGRFRAAMRKAWQEVRRPAASGQAAACADGPWWERKHARSFLRGFTWIGLLYGMAKISTLATQILAGRVLGPQHFGKANLVIAIASFIQILPMMGFQWALSKFPSSEPSRPAREKLVSTTLSMFGLWAVLCLAALTFLRGAIAGSLNVPAEIITDSIIFSFCTALYVVISSPLLGLQRFAERGLSEAVYGFSAPLFFLVFVLHGTRTYHAIILTLCLSLALAAVYSGWNLRTYLKPIFDPAAIRIVFSYTLMAALNLLTAACIVGPGRLFLNRFFDAHQVGIFSAYFTSTAQISLAFLYIITSVLVPVASNPEGQNEAWRSLRRLRPALAAASLLLFSLSAVAALSIFGRQYPFHWAWIATFALAAALILLHGICAALFMARDFSGLRVSVVGNLLAGLGNVGLGLWLIPRWGVWGAGMALVGAYLLGLSYYLLHVPRNPDAALT